MAVDTGAIRAGTDIVAVAGSYTKLKKIGAEFRGRCPVHHGDGDNFYVSPAKRLWRCFSHGCDEQEAGNDVIGLVQLVEGVSFLDACKRLNGGGTDWKPAAPIEHVGKAAPERVTCKPPADAGMPKMSMRGLGEPVRTWAYNDVDGMPLMYVARYETPEGKEIRAWTWGARGDAAPGWSCGHWNRGSRPLYRLDQLAARPESPVMITEGEPDADAAQELLPQYVVTTWPAGAHAWKHADFGPLRGRRVDCWGDNDEPGRKAMRDVCAMIAKGLGCYGKLVDGSELPEGGGAADWIGPDILGWLRPRSTEYAAKPDAAPQDARKEAGLDEPKAGPAAAAPDALESPTSDAPPEPPPPIDFPPEASPEPPRKRRRANLALVGNTALAEEPEAALPPAFSEFALADAFAEEHKRDWRYVPDWGHWMHWDGNTWLRDRKELIDRLSLELSVRACQWDGGNNLSDAERRRLGQKRTAWAVRDISRNDRRIAATAEGWDADPLLIGIPGGVYDLKASRVIAGSREQYITRRTAVAPEDGTPARWLEHMRRMTGGDEAMIHFLQLYAGYCATGEIREQCFVFLYGQGQTGKGTFLLTLADLLGDYAAMADASTFMSAAHEKHTSEIARLEGRRLVVVDETDGTARWNEARLKRMTGSTKITAARKYHDEEDIRITWKLAFAGNHKPALRGVGKEMERRIRLVKCNASIPDEAVDRKFRERMIAEEGPQIIHWIFQGSALWLDAGLPLPASVADATRDYLSSEDIIGDWLAECCETEGRCERPGAYRNYVAWSEKREERPWTSRGFWSALEDRGFTAGKSNGAVYINNLSLKLPADAPPTGYDVG